MNQQKTNKNGGTTMSNAVNLNENDKSPRCPQCGTYSVKLGSRTTAKKDKPEHKKICRKCRAKND